MSEALRKFREATYKEGMDDAHKETALKALAKGKYSVEEIAELSNLTVDEVKALVADL